ncbi:Uncharacterised protein [[Clostridium] sordellii]|nr:hypothetical protein [Paeniclostridium sordellii]CEQ01708.1 Uncharacterised protein [[Clostridium] sordellii] [Paeniclostridium sordellii]
MNILDLLKLLTQPIENSKAFFVISPMLVFISVSLLYKGYRLVKTK